MSGGIRWHVESIAYLRHLPHFNGAELGSGDTRGNLHSLIIVFCINQEIAAELLPRFGERAVRQYTLPFPYAHGPGPVRRLKRSRGEELTAGLEVLSQRYGFPVALFVLGFGQGLLIQV